MGYWEKKGQYVNWYTPKVVFDALGCCFDLDVAGKWCGASYVPASRILESDGLACDWSGNFIWMNPPFGGRNGLHPWMDKFFIHANGIALTPDRTSAPWFQKHWSSASSVLFTPKLRFLREDGSIGESPSNGTALWARGRRAEEALLRAQSRGLGILAAPWGWA